MEGLKYRLVTTGEVHSGFSHEEVQKNLLGVCKHDKTRVERILSGDLFVFTSDIDLVTARRHKMSLDQLGIVCRIEPSTPIVRSEQPPGGDLPAPPAPAPVLSECPKCGASYQGEAVCASCGVVPAKYLERQRLEQEFTAVPVPEAKRKRIRVFVLSALLLLATGAYLYTRYLVPADFKYAMSDWIARYKAPNFEHPLDDFAEDTQDDLLREYRARGFTLDCYKPTSRDTKISDSEDYVCWIPIKSAYNNIPARMVAFFFTAGKVTHVRIDFPESSFDQVQKYLEKKLGNERRLDTVPGYRVSKNIYGEPVMVWEVRGGFVKTAAKATPGQSVMLLWSRKVTAAGQ